MVDLDDHTRPTSKPIAALLCLSQVSGSLHLKCKMTKEITIIIRATASNLLAGARHDNINNLNHPCWCVRVEHSVVLSFDQPRPPHLPPPGAEEGFSDSACPSTSQTVIPRAALCALLPALHMLCC